VKPTAAHALLGLLKARGWLRRVYTQKVDGLEHALLAPADVVECHGSARRAVCTHCPVRVPPGPDMHRLFWGPLGAGSRPVCPECGAPLRPAVTLFGEAIGAGFGEAAAADTAAADVLLVMGTSLWVYPAAAMPQAVSPSAIRVYVGREPAGCFQDLDPCPESAPPPAPGCAQPPAAAASADASAPARWMCGGYRDVVFRGECDAGAAALAAALGWEAELAAAVDAL
jgi:NAD-dependent SIR2 family protein deacetylase